MPSMHVSKLLTTTVYTVDHWLGMHWKEAVEVWENRVVGFVSPQHCLEVGMLRGQELFTGDLQMCLMDKPLVFHFKLMGDYCVRRAATGSPFKGSEISNDLPFI